MRHRLGVEADLPAVADLCTRGMLVGLDARAVTCAIPLATTPREAFRSARIAPAPQARPLPSARRRSFSSNALPARSCSEHGFESRMRLSQRVPPPGGCPLRCEQLAQTRPKQFLGQGPSSAT